MTHSSPRFGRRQLLATSAGLAGLSVVGCSSRATVNSEPTGAAAIEVVDQRGVRVSIPSTITRIATTMIPAPSVLAAVDGSHRRIVGINESTRIANKGGLFADFFPESLTTPAVSPASAIANIETLTELQPDVVFQWGDRGDDVIRPIEQAGFPVVGLLYGSQAHLETWISLFAQVLGQAERGREILDWMHRSAADLKQRLAGTTAVPVVHLSKSGEGFTANNSDTYAQHWITTAGGINLAADNVASDGVVSPEQLIAWNPEVITLGGFDPLVPEDLYRNPSLATIEAIRNRRVYKCPRGAYRMEVSCAESPLMWQWAAAVFHPQLGAGELRSAFIEREHYLYGHQISQDRLDTVLQFEANHASDSFTRVFSR